MISMPPTIRFTAIRRAGSSMAIHMRPRSSMRILPRFSQERSGLNLVDRRGINDPRSTHIRCGQACGREPRSLVQAGQGRFASGWDHSTTRRLVRSQIAVRSHIHPDPRRVKRSASYRLLLSRLECSSGGNEPGRDEPPESDQELARQRHDCNAPKPAFGGADAFAEPLAERTVGLMAQPQPR